MRYLPHLTLLDFRVRDTIFRDPLGLVMRMETKWLRRGVCRANWSSAARVMDMSRGGAEEQ